MHCAPSPLAIPGSIRPVDDDSREVYEFFSTKKERKFPMDAGTEKQDGEISRISPSIGFDLPP